MTPPFTSPQSSTRWALSKELPESVKSLLRGPPPNVGHYIELDNSSNNIFDPNDMEDPCDLAKTLINRDVYRHAFCSAFQQFS